MTDTGQQGLAHYLRSGDRTSLAPCFVPSGNMAYAAVYRNGFLRACVDALAANFPAALVFSASFFLLASRCWLLFKTSPSGLQPNDLQAIP